jgi:hypothetical protein
MILPGTYQNGFAPRDGEPLFPELWRGCVGAWNPGLGPSGLTLRDWSPFKNHGTLTNMDPGTDWVASQGRYALDFDGVDDVVQTASVSRPASITISVWANINYSASTSFARLIEHGLNQSITLCLNKSSFPDRVTLQVGNDAVNTSNFFTPLRWLHIAATVASSGGPTQLFFDGRLVSSFSTSNATTSSQPWYFGGNTGFSNLTSLAGSLSDIAIYNRVLPPNEIRLLASRRGIAYEMAPRNWSAQQIAAYRARYYSQVIGGGVI